MPSNGAPLPNFTWQVEGLRVSVNGGAAADEDGSIVGYAWDWGDGSSISFGVRAEHEYDGPGSYEVTLTVTDDEGVFNSTTKTVQVGAASGGTPARSVPSSPGMVAVLVGLVVLFRRRHATADAHE